MALTYAAWRFQQALNPPLLGTRMLLFRSGLLVSTLCSLTVVSSWFVQSIFRCRRMVKGILPISETASFVMKALSTALLTIGLALFGRGASRPLLAGSGLMFAIVAYGAVLQNGV